MRKLLLVLLLSLPIAQAQVGGPVAGAGSTKPTGAAGGDLSGSYPNPTVAKLNGAAAASYARVDATNTFTSVQKFPNGAKGSPSVAFANATTTGFYWRTAGNIAAAIAGIEAFQFNSTGVGSAEGLRIPVGLGIAASGTDFSVSGADTVMTRVGAGVFKFTDSPASSWMQIDGHVRTVSTLPTCNAAALNMRSAVSDQLTACAAIGVAPTGGGAVFCPVVCNGSGWISG